MNPTFAFNLMVESFFFPTILIGIRDGFEVVGIDLAYVGDSDNHNTELNETRNGVNLKYGEFGNAISGMETEYVEITYIGSVDDQYDKLRQKFLNLGLDVSEKTNYQMKSLMKDLEYVTDFWNDMEQ